MKDVLKANASFRYMMLDRFRTDCEYYLGNGGRSKKFLWALDEKEHIQNMKDLYNTFNDADKPEWLTWEQILNYEKQIVLGELDKLFEFWWYIDNSYRKEVIIVAETMEIAENKLFAAYNITKYDGVTLR